MTGIECNPYVIDTGYLFPPSLAGFLGTEDEVHVFREVTEHLDISHLDSDFNGMSQHPYHPLMLMKCGEFDYSYNAQACTDEGHGVIVAGDMSNEASGIGHLPDMVEEVRELWQEPGFSIELLIASGKEKKEEEKESRDNRVYSLKRFCYDKEGNVWRCPGGQLLRRETVQTDGKYRYACADCAGCKLRPHCLKPSEDRRTLVMEESQSLLGEMRARLKKPEKHAAYRKRKWVAEQPIGQIKEGMGFRGVTMRGDESARGQWLFACAVHIVMKAVRFIASSRKLRAMDKSERISPHDLSFGLIRYVHSFNRFYCLGNDVFINKRIVCAQHNVVTKALIG